MFTKLALDGIPFLHQNNSGLHLILQILLADFIHLYENINIDNYLPKMIQHAFGNTYHSLLDTVKSFFGELIILLYDVINYDNVDINSLNYGIIQGGVIFLSKLEDRLEHIIENILCPVVRVKKNGEKIKGDCVRGDVFDLYKFIIYIL